MTSAAQPTRSRCRWTAADLALTNLAKVLYPADGFTKAEVLDYYQRISAVLLPHVAGRPMTLKRYPDGVDDQSFFAKHAPARPAGLGAHGRDRVEQFALACRRASRSSTW